jgi:hypothetical protein
MIGSYPSIYAIGHRAIGKIFDGPVVVEEKIDGSQFSFGIIDGELRIRSKGKHMELDAPEKLFSKAVEVVKSIESQLEPGFVYRCEYLQKEKHNTLRYGRVPAGHLVLFDVMENGTELYADPALKEKTARKLGLEPVPVLHVGEVATVEALMAFLERESVLGGCKVEGVVVKNYRLFTEEKKVAIGKFVSEAFKEIHRKDWKERNPGTGDILQNLITMYATEARWRKGIQHLRDVGVLEDSPRDIGKLLLEIQADVERECREEITEELWKHFWPKLRRGMSSGFPEFYKRELAAKAFEGEEAAA